MLRSPGLYGTGAAAGHVVGAEHMGAAVGALLTGVVMAPALGITVTALLSVSMKLASAGVFVITRDESPQARFVTT